MIDHYRTLGVSPNAEEVVIRAAYLALMRRYHPDQNDSPEAAERAKRISISYAVLSDPANRAQYNSQLARWTTPQALSLRRAPPRGRGAFLVMALLTLGLAAFALLRWDPARFASPPARALTAADEQASLPTDAAACPDRPNAAAIRQALFRNVDPSLAADRAALLTAAAVADVEVLDVSAEGSDLLGNQRCRAAIVLRLPAGVTTTAGLSSWHSDIWFTPRPAGGANGPPSYSIEPEEMRDQALLSLIQDTPLPAVAAAPTLPPPPEQPAPVVEADLLPPPPLPAPKGRPAAAETPRTAVRMAAAKPRPSRVSRATLAALERHQTLLYNQSFLAADERKRGLLMESRTAFLARLGRCSTSICRRDSYLSHNQEIAAIMGS